MNALQDLSPVSVPQTLESPASTGAWDDEDFVPPEISDVMLSKLSDDIIKDMDWEPEWKEAAEPEVQPTRQRDGSSAQALESLNTPYAAKKPRCTLCTRPLHTTEDRALRRCPNCVD